MIAVFLFAPIWAAGCGEEGVQDDPVASRAVAEWVLGAQGKLTIASTSGEITSASQLPSGAITIRRIDLNDRTVTDDDLEKILGLKALEYLGLYGTGVTDNGLDQIAHLKSLKELELSYTSVTDAGINKLHPLTNLQKLFLNGESDTITETGIERLRDNIPQCEIIR
jgi:hypothetical protein